MKRKTLIIMFLILIFCSLNLNVVAGERKYILEEGPGLSDDYITEPEKMVWPKKEEEAIDAKTDNQINNISVTLNGVLIIFDVQPQIIGNRVMVPLRKIFEAMDASIEWNDETKTIKAVKNGDEITASIGDNDVSINGNIKTLDVPPLIVDNRTLVPVRFVAESFGADVQWNDETNIVVITLK